MTNYLPDVNEAVAELEKYNRERGPIKQKISKSKKRDNLDGTEITKIDEQRFNECFDLFKTLVETKSKITFTSFLENDYLKKEEGYKYDVYEKARKALCLDDWKKEEIGTGKIFGCVISAIKLDETKNNILHWISVDEFAKKKESEQVGKYEEVLFDFFNDQRSDEDSMNDFVELFGKNYPLIGYLFFVKDMTKYMPINPNNFDEAFEKLGVQDFKTSGRCSWKNYSKFNSLLNEVRELLLSKGIKYVSLLDAHSFVWMIKNIEKKMTV